MPRAPTMLALRMGLVAATACGNSRQFQVPPTPPWAPAAQLILPPNPAPIPRYREELTGSPNPATATSSDPPPAAGPPQCPPNTVLVNHSFCPEQEYDCLDSEYDPSNHITLCHRFREAERHCKSPRVSLRFCIDEYEYPNQKGAHPPVMVDWYAAEVLCQSAGKRLCTEDEWTAACEGPEELPFPYGWVRSQTACNIDHPWVAPSLSRLHSPDPAVVRREVDRLDRSVPSGSRPECKSGYGVYDLTGNFDEWIRLSHPRPFSPQKFAGLKGGAWGHVRNACRPVTTSHAPNFVYYFVSFRCCKDPFVPSP